jgi:acyl carrier protein
MEPIVRPEVILVTAISCSRLREYHLLCARPECKIFKQTGLPMFDIVTGSKNEAVNASDVEDALIDRLAVSRSATRDDVLLDLRRTGGQIDSLEGLELVIDAERMFGVRVSDDELSSGICRSVPDLVAFIRSLVVSSPEADVR